MVGNYFQWDNLSNDIDRVTLENTGCYAHFRPIPLTEEWLLKLNFDTKNDQIFTKGRLSYNIHNGWWFGNKRLGRKIKYVHQVQNLYSALSEEEL